MTRSHTRSSALGRKPHDRNRRGIEQQDEAHAWARFRHRPVTGGISKYMYHTTRR
jgi:hypothetical protein